MVAVGTTYNKELLFGVETYHFGEWDELWEAFSEVLHGTITSQNVDDIIGVYEKLMPFLEENKMWWAFQEEFVWFSLQYQYYDIEFKR